MNTFKFLDYAAKQYYSGKPIISDQEFDTLAEEYSYASVGSSVEDGVAHSSRLYSLKKIYKGEEDSPITGDLVETVKLDGAAISLTYFKGKLKILLTRGDGIRGQDISHLIPTFPAPQSISEVPDVYQVNGEVVALKETANARNYAAGALNLKDSKEFKTRDLYFIAYGAAPYKGKTYVEDMNFLASLDFETVLDSGLDKFPTDGIVFRLNSNKEFESAGYTAQFPKGAYALKERKSGVVTKLLDVIWQIGKSGTVSPVGILEPVKIGDATIARATLHNYKYIVDLNLEIGCMVEVIRAGEIIPRIIKRV